MSDESWNAFEKAKADDVRQSAALPDVCKDSVTIGGRTLNCRKTHMYGDTEHEVIINDESALHTAVRLTWRS